MARNAPSIATSIGAAQATVQALDVLRHTNGHAVTIGDDELRQWVVKLAAKEGIWPEASSVAPFAAIERLRAEGKIGAGERCVALLTASGLKDPGPIESALPEPPLVGGGLPELMAALKNAYGYSDG
jgi:threonine synthase